MMYNYPFFSFPHFRRYPSYYSTPYSYKSSINQNIANVQKDMPNSQKVQETKKNHLQNFQEKERFKSQKFQGRNQHNKFDYSNSEGRKNILDEKYYAKKGHSSKRMPSGFGFLNNILHQEDRGDDEEYFDLFGLRLYNDDLLLIGLIFFLYKEEVKDQYLFFALILLLLS